MKPLYVPQLFGKAVCQLTPHHTKTDVADGYFIGCAICVEIDSHHRSRTDWLEKYERIKELIRWCAKTRHTLYIE
mgnify:CR=1 FL=1